MGTLQVRAIASYLTQPESDEDLRLMRESDKLHPLYPFFGSRPISRWLRRHSEEPLQRVGAQGTFRRLRPRSETLPIGNGAARFQ